VSISFPPACGGLLKQIYFLPVAYVHNTKKRKSNEGSYYYCRYNSFQPKKYTMGMAVKNPAIPPILGPCQIPDLPQTTKHNSLSGAYLVTRRVIEIKKCPLYSLLAESI
jgi:hypothetical protein